MRVLVVVILVLFLTITLMREKSVRDEAICADMGGHTVRTTRGDICVTLQILNLPSK